MEGSGRSPPKKENNTRVPVTITVYNSSSEEETPRQVRRRLRLQVSQVTRAIRRRSRLLQVRQVTRAITRRRMRIRLQVRQVTRAITRRRRTRLTSSSMIILTLHIFLRRAQPHQRVMKLLCLGNGNQDETLSPGHERNVQSRENPVDNLN